MISGKLYREFKNPSPEFSPMPFWFWNDNLDEAEITRQMLAFKEKGINGFVIHPRMGLPERIGYMGPQWLSYVKYAVSEAKRLCMKVILYDEAMYPSGSCHGEVVRENPRYASRGLFMRNTPDCGENESIVAHTVRDGRDYYFIEGDTCGTIRGVHYGEDDGEPGAPRSADLLNSEAVACFIRLTHERYYEHLKEEFGSTVIGIFTDEPMICGRYPRPCVPWTGGFLEQLRECGFGEEDLYYLFAEKETPRGMRAFQIYNTAVKKRLGMTYYGQIARWCREHGVALIGHPEKSTDIELLSYFDIPCQDIVWRNLYPDEDSCVIGDHSTMGKCASDSARHNGKRRNGNECFGVCGHRDDPHAFTRDDMKWYIDWLFVRGCNLIIPHAFYYSLRGDRRDERPPEVGMHSAFWEEYHEISDYIKRCCAMNTDSINVTDIAVLCTADRLPWRSAKALFETQTEFNYLEYRQLPECSIRNGCCSIQKQTYRIFIVDDAVVSGAEEFLNAFRAAGGAVFRYDDYGTEMDFIRDVRSVSQTAVDVEPRRMLRVTHLRKYGCDILFCTNEGSEEINTVLHEPVAAVWDAETGTAEEYGGTDYPLHLPRRKSLYLVLKR